MFGLAMALLYGCSQSPVASAPVIVRAGTPVHLILAKQLNAGDTKQGEFVPLLVADDVLVDGRIAIPKGSLATGKVTWSRSEGTLSGLMNQPARLEITLESLRLNGDSIGLAADPSDSNKPFAFGRDNTGRPPSDDAKIESVLKDELNRQLAEKITELFDGKSPDLSTPESQVALERIAGEMGLQNTQNLIEGGKANVGQIASTIERLQRGDISSLARGDLSLSLGTVMELADLAGGLGSRISRSLKGRTIRAYPGTRVEAFIASDSKLPNP